MKHLALAVLLCLAACKSKPKEVAPAKPAETDKPGAAPAPAPAPSAAADADAKFWAWFGEHAAALHDDKDLQHVMETVSAEVEKIHPGVFAEIAVDGDTRTVVLTADGKRDLFPAVQGLYAKRPTIAGWNVVAFRQRDPRPDGMTIEIAGQKIDPTTLRFTAVTGGDKLDLSIFVPGFTTIDEMGQGLFIVLDHTVGEYDMETKIGGLDFFPLTQAPAEARPLTELPALIDKTFPAK